MAPSKLTDIKLTFLCNKRKNGSVITKNRMLPPRAAKNGNDKKVPLNK